MPGRGLSLRVCFLLRSAAKPCGMATGGTLALAAARACPFHAERTEHREALSWESKTGLASF